MDEKETGFSIMVMNEKVDEGKVLYRERIAIKENDNTYTLLEKITNLACNSIIKIINKYVEGSIIALEQDHKNASYTYTIKKNDTYLDFKDDAEVVLAKVRAYNPSNAIRPTIIQRSGKKMLKLNDALNGWKVTPGTFIKNKIEEV